MVGYNGGETGRKKRESVKQETEKERQMERDRGIVTEQRRDRGRETKK